MKQLFIKYAPIIIAITALADTQFELLLQLGLSEMIIGWIKLLGLLTALFLPSIKETFANRQLENSDPQNSSYPTKKF
jgi:hypothetical protein